MKNVSATLTVVLVALFLPWLAYSQQAEAPIYKDGDWWNVKVELKSGYLGSSCFFEYPEYIVKIEKGKASVYGVQGASQEKFECRVVTAGVLGTPGRVSKRLEFPLHVGKKWKKRISKEYGRRIKWTKEEYKVLSWEKVQIPKGMFEAFKLTRSYAFTTKRGERKWSETYYYSPKVKAIVLHDYKFPRGGGRTVTLVDFNVSN